MSFDVNTFFNATILIFVVLGFGSLAGFFCERAGIVNIAIDGQMIFGALVFAIFSMLITQTTGALSGFLIFVPLIISAILSVILSSIFGLLVIKIQANHVISGTAINLVTAGFATFITIPLGVAISNNATPKLKVNYLPAWKIADGFFGETILIIVLALLIMGLAYFVMTKTKFGLRLKAIGDNPNAVDAQGINVIKYKWIGMMLSGIFASLAGSIFILAGSSVYPQSAYFEGNVAGLGFLAIAIVVSGAWRIPFMIVSALVFGMLMTITNIISTNEQLIATFGQYAKYIAKAIPFILSFIVLVIFSRKNFAPKAIGQKFDKSLR